MAFKDLREFIEALDRAGELLRIKQEVDWDLEAAAISRRALEMKGPAILFERIKDYPEGCRILGGPTGIYKRVAIAMGLEPDASIRAIHAEFERREQHPIKPIIVKDGPCKENIMLGDEVDLNCLPAPYIHDGDGGRYIGTWEIVITKDPDSDWTNWGVYRFMVHNETTLLGFPEHHSHLGMILHEKFVPKKQPMPFSLVIGAEPLSQLAASAGYGPGVDEVDYAGALRQEPVELIECETMNLFVPAYSEIVIEGEILPDKVAPEGPFAEYPGYRTEGCRFGVFCKIKAITHRNSPILTMLSLGTPPDDASVAASLAVAVSIKRRLKRHGIPVVEVSCPSEGVNHFMVVSVESGGIEVARRIRDVMTARRVFFNKALVVDKDVDVFNLGEVFHALATKCHPVRGIITSDVEEGKGNRLTPAFDWEERKKLKGAFALFDATWPLEWPKETLPVKSSFNSMYPLELREKVIKNWKDFGFK